MKTDWISSHGRTETIRIIRSVSSLLRVKGPLASELDKLVQQEGMWNAVSSFKFDYSQPYELDDFRAARQIQALVSKQGEWLDEATDTEKVGFERFLESERMCHETNNRLSSARPSGRVGVVLHYAQRKIAEILGDVPSFSELRPSFGPGANTSCPSSTSSHKAKLAARLACSEAMLPSVGDFLAEVPLWIWSRTGGSDLSAVSHDTEEVRFYPEIEIHDGKLVFVPKDARTKRAIVVEPMLNGFFQKGVGSYIRNRLLRVAGVDLRDQSRNREAARRGSMDGLIATVDLSMASDTISYCLVLNLLPDPWFSLLESLRTPVVNYKDTRIELEKFSSMGNAYTFELESLLFYSLTYGVCRALEISCDEVSAYGDDIIVPTAGYELLSETLTWCGFTVNSEKSYHVGPFRESCGADWVRGCDIRPFYLREQVSDRVLYSFHNWAVRNCEFELASLLLSETAEPMRLYGPDGYGDGHLVGSFVLRSNRKTRRWGWEGGVFDTYVLNPKRVKTRGIGDWVYPSYSTYVREGWTPMDHLDPRQSLDPDVVRGSVGYSKVSIYTLATSIFRRI